jgi:hypothetical protein
VLTHVDDSLATYVQKGPPAGEISGDRSVNVQTMPLLCRCDYARSPSTGGLMPRIRVCGKDCWEHSMSVNRKATGYLPPVPDLRGWSPMAHGTAAEWAV